MCVQIKEQAKSDKQNKTQGEMFRGNIDNLATRNEQRMHIVHVVYKRC